MTSGMDVVPIRFGQSAPTGWLVLGVPTTGPRMATDGATRGGQSQPGADAGICVS